MKFALLGDDPLVLPLVRALATDGHHAITHAVLANRLQNELLEITPSVRFRGGWEDLLAANLDAVIVCGSAQLIGESAKQLANAGKALAVLPQGEWDTELIYELSLMRDDNHVILVPICPLLEHPLFQDDPTEVLHLRCEREILIPEAGELTADSLRDLLLSDVGLLRKLGGDYHQVTAVQSLTPTGGIVMATMTLTGENLPDAVWTLRPVNTQTRWQLTITRDSGATTYQSLGESESLTQTGLETPPTFAVGEAMKNVITRGLSDSESHPDWNDLTRDFEVLDAVRRSLAKRRTIDLHFETTSERSVFKTQMTAIGCGMLLFTLFALIAVLFLGSVLDARGPVERTAHNAGTIFYAREFEADNEQFTPAGKAHWDRVENQRRDPAITPILVQQTEDEAIALNRRDALIHQLRQEGIPQAIERVEVRELDGPWFETVMKIARILVFLPLFLFLGMQTLLLITRPTQSQQKSEKSA